MDLEMNLDNLKTKVDFEMNLNNLKTKVPSDIPHILFFACGLGTAFITLFFVAFIFHTALPTFQSQGLFNFLSGTEWSYDRHVYGIRTFIIGTIVMTAITLIMAVPLSLFTAIFLAEFASNRVVSIIRPLIELLVGIPSVVYGIFGLYVLENLFQDHFDPVIDSMLGFIPFFQDVRPGTGSGFFLASVVLTVMVLPTITSLSEDSIRAVPHEFREASFGIGATHWETISRVVLPTASSGILSAIILGMMRAMGETMAIVMLLGNVVNEPSSIFDLGYAMTSKILNDIGYHVAIDEHKSALFAIAAVLFALEILFVGIARKVGGKR